MWCCILCVCCVRSLVFPPPAPVACVLVGRNDDGDSLSAPSRPQNPEGRQGYTRLFAAGLLLCWSVTSVSGFLDVTLAARRLSSVYTGSYAETHDSLGQKGRRRGRAGCGLCLRVSFLPHGSRLRAQAIPGLCDFLETEKAQRQRVGKACWVARLERPRRSLCDMSAGGSHLRQT